MPTEEGEDKLPPHSVEAEKGILGCILLAPGDALPDTEARFGGRSTPFYDLKNKHVYEAIRAVSEDDSLIDIVTVAEKLRQSNALETCGGYAYLSGLTDATPSAANLEYYLDIVWEKYCLRRIINVTHVAREEAYEGATSSSIISASIDAGLAPLSENSTVEILNSHQLMVAMQNDLEERFERHQSGKRTGIESGLWKLDNITDGFQRGMMNVIAALSSVGKSAIGMQIAAHVAYNLNIPTLVITAEMPPKAFMRRLASNHCGIHMSDLRRGDFTHGDLDKITAFQSRNRNKPLYCFNAVRNPNVQEICAQIRLYARRHGVQFVMGDYLQKFKAARGNEKRTYEVADVSERLFGVCQSENVAGLFLAQLKREFESVREKRSPQNDDLADSSAIVKDADFIGLLDREAKSTEAKLFITKQRDGEVNCIDLTFDGQYCRFSVSSPIAQEHHEQPSNTTADSSPIDP